MTSGSRPSYSMLRVEHSPFPESQGLGDTALGWHRFAFSPGGTRTPVLSRSMVLRAFPALASGEPGAGRAGNPATSTAWLAGAISLPSPAPAPCFPRPCPTVTTFPNPSRSLNVYKMQTFSIGTGAARFWAALGWDVRG